MIVSTPMFFSRLFKISVEVKKFHSGSNWEKTPRILQLFIFKDDSFIDFEKFFENKFRGLIFNTYTV